MFFCHRLNHDNYCREIQQIVISFTLWRNIECVWQVSVLGEVPLIWRNISWFLPLLALFCYRVTVIEAWRTKAQVTTIMAGIYFLVPRRVNLCQKYWHGLFMSVRRGVTVSINIWKDFLPTPTTTTILLHQISISSCPSHYCDQNIDSHAFDSCWPLKKS